MEEQRYQELRNKVSQYSLDNIGSNYFIDKNLKSNLNNEQNIKYISNQSLADDDWKLFKAVYNGLASAGRGVLGAASAVAENVAIHQRQDPNYKPYGNYANKIAEGLESAARSDVLTPYAVRGNNFAEQLILDIAQGAGQLAGQVGATLLTGGIGGGVLMGAQIAGNQYLDLRDKGVDIERAAQAGLYNAMFQAPLEQLGVGKILSKTPAGTVLREKLRQIRNSAITEGLTEALQKYPEVLTNLYAENEGKTTDELLEMFKKDFGKITLEAGYEGIIGGILGAGGSGANLVYNERANKEIKKAVLTNNLENQQKRIEDIQKSGVNPKYAAVTINNNMPDSYVYIDGETLFQYASEKGIEKTTEALGLTVAEITNASNDGSVVEIKQGTFEAACASDMALFQTVKEHISYSEDGYSLVNLEEQSAMSKETVLSDEAKAEFDTTMADIRKSMDTALIPKAQADELEVLLTARAMAYNPENPAQWFKDHPLEFTKNGIVSADGYNQIAYHGTSAKNVERLSTDYVGSRNANVYGWGLYFGSKETANAYTKPVLENEEILATKLGTFITDGGKWINKNTNQELKNNVLSIVLDCLRIAANDETHIIDIDFAKNLLSDYDFRFKNEDEQIKAEKILNDIAKSTKFSLGAKTTKGELFKVDIPEDDMYYDWDKPVKEQKEQLKQALLNEGLGENDKGFKVYNMIRAKVDSAKAASLWFKENGVLGYKVNDPDEGMTYVVFDDNAINVIDKQTYYQNVDYEQIIKSVEFKKWFGNWEAPAIKEFLINGPMIKIEDKGPNEIKKSVINWRQLVTDYSNNKKGAQKNLLQFLRPYIPDVIKNTEIGDIKFSNNSIRNSLHHANGRANAMVLPYIENILQTAKYIGQRDIEGNRTSLILANALEYQGQRFIIVMVANQDSQGNTYYDHEFTTIKKIDVLPAAVRTKAKQADTGQQHQSLVSILYEDVWNVNSFDDVDDDGKPKISAIQKFLNLKNYNQQAKGQINFNSGKSIINLFDKADASTVIHETGHYFVEALAQDVALGRANEQAVKDWNALLEYCGITQAEWDKGGETRVKAHERLAEGFETYLMEGKAPSPKLRKVFAKFAKWIKAVYRKIRRSDNAVDLTDEVREVFDRMLASDEMIAEQARINGIFAKLPKVITDNLSEKQNAFLMSMIEKARETATTLLVKDSLRNFSQERREEIAKYREANEASVKELLMNNPLYAASEVIVSNIEQVYDGKANIKKLAELYLNASGDDISDYEADVFNQFDVIGEMYGFASGDDLAKQILEKPTFNEAVNAYLDNMVQQKYPDIYKERRLAEKAAKEDLYNEDMGAVIGLELELVNEAMEEADAKQKAELAEKNKIKFTEIGVDMKYQERRRTNEELGKLAKARNQQAKAAAQYALARMSIRDAIRVDKYINAERKCAVKAAEAMAKKDFARAQGYKQQQLYNHACVREAMRLRKRFEQHQKYLHKQSKAKRDTWYREEFFNQAGALFARMGITLKGYDATMHTQTLQEFVDWANAEYDNADIADWIVKGTVDISTPKNLTFSEYEDVVNAFKNIKALARLAKGQNAFNSQKEFEEWKAEALENLGKLKTKWKADVNKTSEISFAEKYLRMLTNADAFFEKMDNDQTGFFTKWIFETAKMAQDKETEMVMRYEQRKRKAYKNWLPTDEAKKEASKMHRYEELGGTEVNKHNLINMLIYLTTKSSSDKLCSTAQTSTYFLHFRNSSLWVEGDVEATRENILEFLSQHLTEADIEYAQAKVDAANMFWEELEALEKRTKGFRPNKEEAYPATLIINGKEVRFTGGYIPLVRDRQAGSRPKSQEAIRGLEDDKPGANIRTLHTNTGSTKARDASVYPLDLTEGFEDGAVMDTIHDICFRELMSDYRRMFNDAEMYQTLKEKLGEVDLQSLEEYARSVAQPYGVGGYSSLAGKDMGGWLSTIRRKAVYFAIMGKFSTVFQNVGNILLYGNNVEGFTIKDSFIAMTNWRKQVGDNGKGFKAMREFVTEKSVFMRERMEIPDISLRQIRDEKAKPNIVEQKAVEFGTKMLVYTDNITALPVWIHAYNKQMQAGMSEQEAINFADTVIRRTLGSSRKSDVAPMFRDDSLKLFTVFQSFFNTQFNQWAREFRLDSKLIKNGEYTEAAKNIAAFAGAKFIAANMLSLILTATNPFADDDEDDYMNITKSLLTYPLQMAGPAGTIATVALQNAIGMKNYGYRITPAQSAFDTVIRTAKKANRVVTGKAEVEELVEPATNVLAMRYGLPQQITAWFWNAYDIFVNDMDLQGSDVFRRRSARER